MKHVKQLFAFKKNNMLPEIVIISALLPENNSGGEVIQVLKVLVSFYGGKKIDPKKIEKDEIFSSVKISILGSLSKEVENIQIHQYTSSNWLGESCIEYRIDEYEEIDDEEYQLIDFSLNDVMPFVLQQKEDLKNTMWELVYHFIDEEPTINNIVDIDNYLSTV